MMATRRWTVVAGILTLSGCGGGAEAPPSQPAAGVSVAGNPEASIPVPKQYSDWAPYYSADGGYSVLLPKKLQVTWRIFTVHIVSREHRGVSYTVTYFDPPARTLAPGVVEATIKRDRDMSVQNIKGSLQSEEKISIRKDGKDWPGLASVMEDSVNVYTSRLYAVEGRIYSLQIKYAKSRNWSADNWKFFDSFKISDSSKAR
jgi:hypothetical protein